MTDLKYCFFCMTNDELPWLYELMSGLKENGVELYRLDSRQHLSRITVPGNSYLITDNMTGISFARLHDTGYIVYLPPGGSENGSAPVNDISDAECVIEGFDEITPDFVEKMFQRKHDIPWTILETPRTVVKELSENDIDALFELYQDPEIKHNIPPLMPSKQEELEFQKAYIRNMYGFFGYGFWNVLDRTTGKLIGRAGLSNRKDFDDPELGYLFSGDFRGKGIASEVCTAIISYAGRILGINRLNAFIRPDNIRSVRFAVRLGFKETGEEILSAGHKLKRYVLQL